MKQQLTRFILTAGLYTLFGSLVLPAQDQKEKANCLTKVTPERRQ